MPLSNQVDDSLKSAVPLGDSELRVEAMSPTGGSRESRNSFTQDALHLIGNRFLIMLVTFGTGVMLARSLGADGRGVIAAVLVYPTMFLSLTEMGVRQSSIFYIGKQIFTDRQVVGAVSTLILLTGLIGIIVCTGLLFATGNAAFTPMIIALAVGTIPFTLVIHYSSGIFLGKQLVRQFAWVQRMAKVQQLLMVVILVWWLALDVPGALVAILLSSILVAGFALWRVSQIAPLRPSFDWSISRALLFKGTAYAISSFLMILNYKIDVVMMERLTSASEIGTYIIAVEIAQLTWVLPQSINTALFSHSANAQDEQAFARKVARLFRVSVLISFLLVAGLAVASPFLIPAMYGNEFIPSVRAMQLLLPGVFCLLLLKILNMDLAGRGRPMVSLWVKVPALVVNILLNLYLLPRYGARGAAVASSVSYSLTGVGFMVLYCRVTGLRLAELWHYQRSDFNFVQRLLPGHLSAKRRTP